MCPSIWPFYKLLGSGCFDSKKITKLLSFWGSSFVRKGDLLQPFNFSVHVWCHSMQNLVVHCSIDESNIVCWCTGWQVWQSKPKFWSSMFTSTCARCQSTHCLRFLLHCQWPSRLNHWHRKLHQLFYGYPPMASDARLVCEQHVGTFCHTFLQIVLVCQSNHSELWWCLLFSQKLIDSILVHHHRCHNAACNWEGIWRLGGSGWFCYDSLQEMSFERSAMLDGIQLHLHQSVLLMSKSNVQEMRSQRLSVADLSHSPWVSW